MATGPASISTDKDDLFFVTSDHIELRCPICLELLVNRSPYLIECCGKHICAKCIGKLKDKPCPLCRTQNYKMVQDKSHQRAMKNLMIYCSQKEKGCQWIGKSMHNGSDIRSEVLRSLLDDHETKECTYRTVSCEFAEVGCKWLGTVDKLPQHLADDLRHHIAFATHYNTKQVKDELNETIFQLRSRIAILEEQAVKNAELVSVNHRISELETALERNAKISDRVQELQQDQTETILRVDTLDDQTKEISIHLNQLRKHQKTIDSKCSFLLQQGNDAFPSLCKATSSDGNILIIKKSDCDNPEETLIVKEYSTNLKRDYNRIECTPISGPMYTIHNIEIIIHCNGVKSDHGSYVSIAASHTNWRRTCKGYLAVILRSNLCDFRYGVLIFDGKSDEVTIEKFIPIVKLGTFLHPDDSLCFDFKFLETL